MSAEGALIDWSLAERIAGTVIGGIGPVGRPAEQPRSGYSARQVEAACAEAIALASDYAGLGTVAEPPPAELIDSREWARNALGTLAEAAGPVEERLAADLSLPGPLQSIARRALGGAAGAEAGLAVGYAARRVLGQYDLPLFGSERPGRLLIVAPNMEAVRRRLDADPELFLHWVALHETTHVIQFECVGWLAGYLRRLAGQLVEGAAAGLDSSGLTDLGRRLLRDPRELVRAALRGELARVLADPAQRATLDRMQAVMSVIEGHAEHVMDAAARDHGPGLAELRRRVDERRARRSGLGDVIGRLLGIDLKLRQYELGKAFCDAVVEQAGHDALRLVWRAADDLPDLAELEAPRRWLDRVAAVPA